MGRGPGSSEEKMNQWGFNAQVHGSNTRISLYSYLYLKLAKMLCLYYFLGFLFNKIREQEGGTGSAQKLGLGRR
jgi:hypothetical protein